MNNATSGRKTFSPINYRAVEGAYRSERHLPQPTEGVPPTTTSDRLVDRVLAVGTDRIRRLDAVAVEEARRTMHLAVEL